MPTSAYQLRSFRCDELALRLYAKLTDGQDGLPGDLAAACR